MKTILVLSSVLVSSAFATPKLDLIAENLKNPTWLTAPIDSSKYLYILEQPGTIRIFDRNTEKILPTPFLDIRNRIKIKMNEQGLLGMAFCPDFKKTGRFYLNYTDLKGDTQIVRFSCDPSKPLLADPAKSETLLSIKQDFRNHNGGWIAFGPDKMLYVGMGDGGAANDPRNRAQNLSTHLGKLLRIDVSGTKGYSIPKDNPFRSNQNAKPEIYAYGLRNPWRCSWDRKTQDFYIADVGQGKLEEINFQFAGKGAGANYGWRKREGEFATPMRIVGGAKPSHNVDPVYNYGHGMGSNQGLSITGGYVYRGSIKELQGRYFFADYLNPRIWSITMKDGKATAKKDWTVSLHYQNKPIRGISSFAEDPQGELYIISYFGKVFKITE